MEQFNAALATAFDLDPARMAATPTVLTVDEFDSVTNPGRAAVCMTAVAGSFTAAAPGAVCHCISCGISPDLEWTEV